MHSALKRNISAGDEIMWNSRKYTAMAVVGVGLAVAAATPASAQLFGLGGAYGYAGGCGGFGWPPGVMWRRGRRGGGGDGRRPWVRPGGRWRGRPRRARRRPR